MKNPKNRSSDKTEPFKVVLAIISPILTALLMFYITSIKSDIKDLRTELKETNKEITKVYREYKEEVNSVRIETQKQIAEKYDQLKDQLMAMVNKINREKN